MQRDLQPAPDHVTVRIVLNGRTVIMSRVKADALVAEGNAVIVDPPGGYITKSATNRKRIILTTKAEAAAGRQVTVICSSATADRAGDIVVQTGIDLTNYRRNPVVLWQHNPDCPIARAVSIGVIGGNLQATVQFPPEGKDTDADKVYVKIAAGIVNAASIGFIPIKSEPANRLDPFGGQRFLQSELVEFSFVSVPANPDALITQRSAFAGVNRRAAEIAALLADPRTRTEVATARDRRMAAAAAAGARCLPTACM